jgi:hypothetical protein
MATNTPPRKQSDNEEPELGADESVPLDGKDPVGEEMMKDLGRDMKKNRQEDESDPGPLPEQFPAS